MFRRGLCPPLYNPGIGLHEKVLVEYYSRSPTQCLSGSFLLFDQFHSDTGSYNGIRYMPCTISYSRIFYACKQSRCLGSNNVVNRQIGSTHIVGPARQVVGSRVYQQGLQVSRWDPQSCSISGQRGQLVTAISGPQYQLVGPWSGGPIVELVGPLEGSMCLPVSPNGILREHTKWQVLVRLRLDGEKVWALVLQHILLLFDN